MVKFERDDGNTFEFGGLFKIKEISGVGTLTAESFSEKKAFGDGDVLLGKRIPSRMIDIKSECEFNSMNDIASQTARRFFNSNYKYKMHIKYRNNPVWIPCETDVVDLPTHNIYQAQEFNLSLFCPEPYFRSLNEFGKDIASIRPALGFPLISPVGRGFVTGVYNFARTVFVDNDGDTKAFCRAVIKAEGLVQNFKLSKNDKEFMLFTKDMEDDDELVIDFTEGTVRLNGENAIHYTDRNSTFFGIDIGGSNIKYDATAGENVVKVFVFYNKLYSAGV